MNKHHTVGIFLHPFASIGPAFLIHDILNRANNLSSLKKISVEFVAAQNFTSNEYGLSVKAKNSKLDYLIIGPMNTNFRVPELTSSKLSLERKFLKDKASHGTKIASACLGSLLLAECGFLTGKRATTHWAWISKARELYPATKWDNKAMLIEDKKIITSGGYLAFVDLTLSIVSKTLGVKLARIVAQRIVADTVRQSQSLYSTNKLDSDGNDHQFQKLNDWIDANIHRKIKVSEMAKKMNTSQRNFQRQVIEQYGVTPNQLLQHKRIELAKRLMRTKKFSLEEVVEKIGLYDTSSFRKIFIREVGLSPSEFKKRS